MQYLEAYKSEKYPTKWEKVVRDLCNVENPLIRAVDIISGLKCKLSFSSGSFVETGKRLKTFIEAVPMSEYHPSHLRSQPPK